jgi:CheY-like chemotaxis protein
MPTENRRILLVDDDPLVLRLYQEALSQQGVQVDTAGDGMAAIQALRVKRPDVVVLDLMMPRFSGVDVLKFIRAREDLANVPVVVLSNSYMNEMAQQAVSLGVQKALLKVRCSPSVLMGIINSVCEGKPGSEAPLHLSAVPREALNTPPSSDVSSPPSSSTAAALPAKTPEPESAAAKFQNKARACLLDNTPATCAALRSLCQAIANAKTPTERATGLQNLCRKVHFIAATANLAECHQLAQLTAAFEALLFELSSRPTAVTPSVLRTIAATVDFVGLLFAHAREASPEAPPPAFAMVVDDDPISNRMVTSALQRAGLQARSTDDPTAALHWLQEKRYDLVLLDIEMPRIDGFELCRRLRLLPGYQQTPVIYVTAHDDFEHRAKSALSGGDDFISKPVLSMELAVKALTQLVKRQLGL